MKSVNPVGWFDIHVSNIDRAKKFYSAVFKIQFTDLPIEWGRQSFFPFDYEGANISGALVEKTDMIPNGNNTIVYFETEDCTAEEQRIAQAGGTVVQPKTHIGEFGYIAIFIDSEGNTIGLHSQK